MIPSADRFAASAVNAFGLTPTMAGWWTHDLQAFLVSTLVPDFIIKRIVMNMMSAGRKRWLKKQEQKRE